MISQGKMLLPGLLLLHGLIISNCTATIFFFFFNFSLESVTRPRLYPPAVDVAREAGGAKSIPGMHGQPSVDSDDENYMVVVNRIHQLAENRDQFFARAKNSVPPAGKQSPGTVGRYEHARIKGLLIEGIGLEKAACENLSEAHVSRAMQMVELAAQNQKAAEDLQQKLLTDGKKLVGIEDLEYIKNFEVQTEKLKKEKEALKPLPDLDQLYKRFQILYQSRLGTVKDWENPAPRAIPQKREDFLSWLKRFLKKISLYNLVIRHVRRRIAICAMSRAVEEESQVISSIAKNEKVAALRHLIVSERYLARAKSMQNQAQEAGYCPIYLEDVQSYSEMASKVEVELTSYLEKMTDKIIGLTKEIIKKS